MRKVYFGLSGLLLFAIVVQFYFAAVGAFAEPRQDSSFVLHDVTGMMVIPLLSILATVAALVVRAPGRLVGLTILPVGLVVVQALIVAVGHALSDGDGGDRTTPLALAVLGLHALNGLAIMGVAGSVFARSRYLAFGRPSRVGAGA